MADENELQGELDLQPPATPEAGDDDELEIEVVDDVPEDEKPRRAEGEPPDLPDDDEVENYSEAVQKRIKKLKFEYHEAERQRLAAARERDEAINYARQVSDANHQLSERLSQGQTSVVDTMKAKLTSDLDGAKKDYRQAYEAGDTDAILDAQTRMVAAQSELTRINGWRPQPVQPQPEFTSEARRETAQPQAPQLNQQQQKWLAENDWFGVDAEMTGTAYGLHEQLVRNGVDPNSETYYSKIDEGMRKRFPDKFDSGTEEVEVPEKKKANVVAPATRSAKNPRKIRLTSTQVALAKRLGLTAEQYAAQLVKEARNG